MILAACVKSGALLSPFKCHADCPDLTMTGAHHCERLLVDIAVRAGGLSRYQTAELLGWPEYKVQDVEQAAMRHSKRRLAMVAAKP